MFHTTFLGPRMFHAHSKSPSCFMIPWWGFRAASDYLPKGPNCFSKNQWGLNCVMLLSCGPSVACYLDMVLTVSCYLDGLPISLFYFIGVPTASCYLIGVPTVECSLNGVPSVLCYRQGVPTVSWFPSFMLFFRIFLSQICHTIAWKCKTGVV